MKLLKPAAAVCVASACLLSCDYLPKADHHGQGRANGKVVVVFLDRSGSTRDDREIYRRALKKVLARMNPGDRFIMSAITATSSADFVASLDREFPEPPSPMNILFESEQDYETRVREKEKELSSFRASLSQDVDRILAEQSRSPRTAIIESLMIAAQIFAAEKERRAVLVLLSDMMEESEFGDFTRMNVDDSFTTREIERQREARVLPNLKDVRVYVAGARAPTPERAAAIEHFWRSYFSVCGAIVVVYGRDLFTFEE